MLFPTMYHKGGVAIWKEKVGTRGTPQGASPKILGGRKDSSFWPLDTPKSRFPKSIRKKFRWGVGDFWYTLYKS